MHTANIIAVMYRTFINLEKLLLPSSFYFRIFIEYKNFYIIHKHMIMRFFYATCTLCFGAFICGCSLKSSPESFCARTVGDCDIVDLSKYPSAAKKASEGAMIYADSSRTGIPFSKDPHVVFFGGRYIMYFSIPPYSDKEKSAKIKGWGIGIAESSNLRDWKKIGEIIPENECEKNGICAPGAVIRDGVVHLFYQTYGNFPNDCICHAWSADGVNFVRNPSNPVFAPDGDWNNGRAIDAEVVKFGEKYLMYFATRDATGKIQMQGVAETDEESTFGRGTWRHLSKSGPILKPELPWETKCIEAASAIVRGGKVYMFYAGGYNNDPQQINVAVSDDGVNFKRLFDAPILPNGRPGEWNSSESGHPHIFAAPDGKTYLFYQGNDNGGKNWFLSNVEIIWEDGLPKIAK